MAAIKVHRPGPALTRALVARAAGGEPGTRLRSQVAAWRPGARAEQVEDAVQHACLLATVCCRGQSEGEVFVWLRTTARRELARGQRRARRELPTDAAAIGLLARAGVVPSPEQELTDRADELEFERVTHAVVRRLSPRQREIVALHVRGVKRPEIAAQLGLTPRVVKRELERIMGVGRAELLRMAGHGCPAGEPRVARLAFGLAGPRDVRGAQLHLATCPRCGALYERLDLWREKVAALLPLPAVEQARPGVTEWALQRAGEGLAGLKQHASAGYSRALDPTPLAGVRPGRSRRRDHRLSGDRGRHDVLRDPERRSDRRAGADRRAVRRSRRGEDQAAPAARRAAGHSVADFDARVDAGAGTDGRRDAGARAAPADAAADRGGDAAADPGADAAAGPGGGVRAGGPGRARDHGTPAGAGARGDEARAGAGGRTGGVRRTMSRKPERRKPMRSTPTFHLCALAGACVMILMAPAPASAQGGVYKVGNCEADRLNFNTRAFENFATRGMMIRRACHGEGNTGDRGLTTTNIVRRARLARGSEATLTLRAPEGTRFASFTWGGSMRRNDCGFALRLYAIGEGIQPIAMKNVRANRDCPDRSVSHVGGWPAQDFNVAGATEIVQRVYCVGNRDRADRSCSARYGNHITTFSAVVTIVDERPPAANIVGDTPLARGEWVRGDQPLNYDASDNVGVRSAEAMIAGESGGSHDRPCAFAVPTEIFAEQVPCPNGPGPLSFNSKRFADGSHALVVRAQDPAGNLGESAPVTARIDNTPPGRVDVSVAGGQEWRNRNDFAVAWSNPSEADRAPIAGASYTLCPAGAGSCVRGEHVGADIAGFGVAVPAPGEWKLSLWRRDAALNQADLAASVPVTLRYDPDPPELGFEASSASDPTLVAVQVSDKVSGLADGAIEIGPSGSGTWHVLPTQRDGSRLLARIDDVALPAGGYVLRARASDRARNEASTERRLDGQAMALTLPLRTVATMQASFEQVRTVRRTIRRHGKRRRVRRSVTVLTPAALVRAGAPAPVAGRLVNPDGQGIAGAEVRVFSSSPISPEQQVAVLQTDGEGRYRYPAAGSSNQTLRLEYAGSPLVLPAQAQIAMSVPALTSLRPSRRKLLNGQTVTFTGQLRTLPAPADGKLVELQVRLSGAWQTFRTIRSDAAGRWATKYRFRRTRGLVRYRFRAQLPAEGNYPFLAGGSRAVTVRVRGR